MDFSTATIVASLIVGSLGFGLFLYGKKQLRVPQLAVGIAMMTYPCFLSSAALTYGIAGALVVGLWFAVRLGW